MKILAIDTSGMVASAAVLTEEKILGELTINNKKTHSQTLLPMIDTLMKMLEMEVNDVDLLAVASGPGSFTGLRIGSATAKGLALACNKQIVSVPTLEGLAYNVTSSKSLICSIMDARNNQVFAGVYRFEQGQLKVVMEQTAIIVDDLVQTINEWKQPVIFVGDGADVYKAKFAENITVPFEVAPMHTNRQRASAVGMAALRMVAEGKIETADEHIPEYLRLSQAEREMKERMERQVNQKNS